MVAALPFMCAGAKMYLPIVLQIFTTNLLSLPNISHDVEKEIFKGCGQTKKKKIFFMHESVLLSCHYLAKDSHDFTARTKPN